MKFLCVPCDRPMKMRAVTSDRGSLSVVYSCPDCGYEMAMLTNPYETQMVQSLGVRVGPGNDAGATASVAPPGDPDQAAHSGDHEPAGGTAEGSKCPFASMIPGMESVKEAGGQASIRWTSAAEARLANVPSFVRPMARTGIEKFAREQGCVEVDEKVLDAARDFFGM